MCKQTLDNKYTCAHPIPDARFFARCNVHKKNKKTSEPWIFKPAMVFFCLLLVLLASCTNSAPPKNHALHTPTALPLPSPSASWQAIPGQLSPTIDQITQQVIQNISAHGWNPAAQVHGRVTGGLFINWQMNNPGHTNALKQGSDDVTASSHDPQVDLFYLNALAEYHMLHPQDHSYDGELQKALHQVFP